MNDAHKQLQTLIKQCMLFDRFKFTKNLKNLSKDKEATKQLENLEKQITRSIQRAETRASTKPVPGFPENLPINQRQEDICKAIEEHQVIILCGETGSGKTTQLPKLCLKIGRGTYGMIGHTQPRRIAARSVASRIAEELNTELGTSVGYKIRFSDKSNKNSHIKVMTDGILLAEIQNDPFLQNYDTLIIDEAHERSLNIDFILGYLKQLLPKRPDLKIIITSATIDPERFAKHFINAPIIEVSGRTYPVEVRYRPLNSDEENETKKDQQQAILNAVDELSHETSSNKSSGDVLIFLSGERQIREAAEALRKHHPDKTEIIPLYSRLSNAEQQKVFKSHAYRRIILATNVAETSLTIPGIQYVIDTGYARISRYSYRTKVQRLPIERVSQASANQRKGRCGRTSDGICIRLYSEDDFNNRQVFTDPEILRTNLASVILQMHNIRLGNIEKFPFIDKPDSRLIKDGYQLLEELQAMNKQNITHIGKILSRFPIEPRYARMLIAANEFSSLNEVLIIVSALSIADPRERPMDKQQQADQAHSQFKDEKSDFIAYLNLWNFYQEQRQHLSQNKLRKLCKASFLSYTRMLEWRDIHSQLLNQCNEVKYKINTTVAGYDAIHQALLSGLLSHAGLKNEDGEYQGARNNIFAIFPGSNLRKKRPLWIMAAEMLETQRHYGLTVAQIDPLWLEKQASHLIKKSYFEAHWEKRPAQIAAYEKSTLYGLIINPRKKINYGPIDPEFSRELFIRGAFVNREYSGHAAFFQHNEKLFTDIEKLEHQSRRQDVLVDDEVVYQFYDECIPAGIYNSKRFDTWRKEAEKNNAKTLFLNREYLMQHSAGDITEEQYPKQLVINNTALPLSYHFDPASEDDGVTLTLPLALLNTLNPVQFEWLIPALLRDKITQLIKTLPKNMRKNFVPVPQFTDACIDAITDHSSPLIYSISQQLTRITGIEIPDNAWQIDSLDAHFFMRFDIRDQYNKKIAHGRNLRVLQESLSQEVSEQFSKNIKWEIEQKGLTEWSFDKLPSVINKTQNSLNIKGFPALQDDDESISIVVIDNENLAQEIHHDGLKRLYFLALKQQVKYLNKNLPNIQKICMSYTSVGSCNDLKLSIIDASIEQSFFTTKNIIRDKESFNQNLQQGSNNLVNNANEICAILTKVFDSYHKIRKQLKQNNKPNWLISLNDIQSQLDHLIYEDFIYFTPIEYLNSYPRYLQAIQQRLDKLQETADRDRQYTNILAPYWEHFVKLNDEYYEHPVFSLYRWMLEEYRVSLFAQGLKTLIPVSEKRLEKQWQEVKKII
ncbi:MAG: ATP-dependent RNA helicase HrpA [Gammaproteobacteria bacterium]|nr:ATP-dependent RNA helicase HrpA [Gammaproteobacteria bacterium]